MMFATLRYDGVDRVATITLDRPDKLIAYNTQMMSELGAAFVRSDRDDDGGGVLRTGAGRAFCAGADLSGGQGAFERQAEDPARAALRFGDLCRDGGGGGALRFFDSLKPVVAAINGAAVGVGATMLLPADIRLASTSARFGFVFTRRGIVPEAASSWFLPRLVGIETALEWSYSGKVFGAEEAQAKRLVRSLHAPGDLLPAARALAQELTADSAPVSIAITRQMMWRMLGAAHPMEAHRIDSRMIWARGASGDAAEGIAAFLEKRAALFRDPVSAGLPHAAAYFEDPEYF